MRQTVTQAPEQSGVFPSLCRGKMLLRLLVLTQAVAILLAFAPGISGDPWLRLGVISLCSHWITLLSLGFLCPALQRLPRVSLPRLATLVGSTLLLATVLVSLVIWWYFAAGLPEYQSVWHFTAANMLLAFVVSLLLIQLLLMHAERARLLVAQQRAELDALQARIAPHFLFNSLNAIAELTHQSSAAAEQSLLDLADLFRAAMQAGQLLPLSQELALARKYLQLESIRLGDKLQLDWQLPADYPDTQLPALTLQPLLENAVRYGVEPASQPVTISVQLLVGQQQLVLLITNPINHSAVQPAAALTQQNGIALSNIRNRLDLLYAERQQFSCSAQDGVFRVKLVLPIIKRETADAGANHR